jgi:hypothetical protein
VKIERIGPLALFLFILAIAPLVAVAETGGNSSDNSVLAMAGNSSNLAIADNTSISAVEIASIQGIWRVSLAGTDITMAVNQSGESIYGRCKFEGPEPWNGVMTGSLSGRMLNIAMAAMQGKVQISTQMIGAVADGSIDGNYSSYDSNGNLAKGSFTATNINPDVSGYSPAKVAEASSLAAEQPNKAEQSPTAIGQQIQTPTVVGQPYQPQKSKVTDVTQLAKGIDPNIMPRHAPL